MNKQKLIGLITKKQTYKDTKYVQADIFKKKQEAVNVSISAIYHILKDDYNAQAKLYAVRYLKDCFEKGNQSFIHKTQVKILPLLVKFVSDSFDDKAVLNYGGSYTKTADLEKFKTLVTSFFIMSRQCIEKWALWIPDSQRQFHKAKVNITRQFGQYQQQYQYFRAENQAIFRQNCKKNNVKLPQPEQIKVQKKAQASKNSASNISSKNQQPQPFIKAPSTIKPSNNKHLSKINLIISKAQTNISTLTMKQFQEMQQQFNGAVNEYIQEASEFDDKFIEQNIQKFQELKEIVEKNRSKKKQSQVLVAPKVQIKTETPSSNIKMEHIQPQFQSKSKNDGWFSQTVHEPVKGIRQQKQSQKSEIKNQSLNSQNAQVMKNQTSPVKPSVKKISQISKKEQEERVDFSVSESDEDDKKPLTKQKQFEGTAQFILIQNIQSKPPHPPKSNGDRSLNSIKTSKKQQQIKQLPLQGQSSRIQFDNSLDPSLSNYNKSNIKQSQSKLTSNNQKKIDQPINQSKQFSKISNENEKILKQKEAMENKVIMLQRQIALFQQSEKKMMEQIKNTTSYSEVNGLKKQLISEKTEKNLLSQEVNELKNQLRRMKGQFDKSRREKTIKDNSRIENNAISASYLDHPQEFMLKNSRQKSAISHGSYKITKIKNITVDNENQEVNYPKNYQENKLSRMEMKPQQPYSPRIDQDYIDNKTHYDNIGSWLNESNVERFRLCVLGLVEIFYEDQNIIISKRQDLYSQDHYDYLKMTYTYKFRRCQDKLPKIAYKNTPEIDLWTKPLTGKLDNYTQQIVGKLCIVPMKIIKASVNGDNNLSLSFLLPFMYYNYLRPNQFQPDQFQEVFSNKYDNIIKSKVFFLNSNIVDTPKKYCKIFRQSIFREQFLQFCLEQESYQRVFMIQIEFLKNQKAIIRILPIPTIGSMATKAKQLLNNLIFLIGE